METERQDRRPGGPGMASRWRKFRPTRSSARQHSVHINSDNRSIWGQPRLAWASEAATTPSGQRSAADQRRLPL